MMAKFFKKVKEGVLTALVHAIYFILGVVMRIIYIPHVEYKDPAAKEAMKSGAVLIANHKSHKDGIFVPKMLFGTKTYVLVTRKWYDKKYLKPLFSRLNYIPINLNEADAQWMVQAETALKNGSCVLIFPEGKLAKDGVHAPFQSGFLLPAKHLNVPVIPMAIVGDYKLFHRQKLIVGSPLKLNLQEPGRLSKVLKTASQQCENSVFALEKEESQTKECA